MTDTLEQEEVTEEILDDVVETQEESAEVVEQEEVTPEVEADWRDDEIKSLAQEFGWNEADLAGMDGPEQFFRETKAAIRAAERLAQRTNQQAGGEREPARVEAQAPASESPAFAELDLSDLEPDDPIRAKLEQFQKTVKSQFDEQQKLLQSIQQQNYQTVQQRDAQEWAARMQTFDNSIGEIDPDTFGKGRLAEVSSSQQHLRQQVWNDFVVAKQAFPNRSDDSLMRMVLADRAELEPTKRAPDPRVRARAKNVQSRPSGGKATEESFEARFERLNAEFEANRAKGDN